MPTVICSCNTQNESQQYCVSVVAEFVCLNDGFLFFKYLLFVISRILACECVQFSSDFRSHGSFTSPNFPQIYQPNINCVLYTFTADDGEIVELKFLDFDMQVSVTSKWVLQESINRSVDGTMPSCCKMDAGCDVSSVFTCLFIQRDSYWWSWMQSDSTRARNTNIENSS